MKYTIDMTVEPGFPSESCPHGEPEEWGLFDEWGTCIAGEMLKETALMIRDCLNAHEALVGALRRLRNAADPYCASQDSATDDRVGIVQPVTVAEGEELNRALDAADRTLRVAALTAADAGDKFPTPEAKR